MRARLRLRRVLKMCRSVIAFVREFGSDSNVKNFLCSDTPKLFSCRCWLEEVESAVVSPDRVCHELRYRRLRVCLAAPDILHRHRSAALQSELGEGDRHLCAPRRLTVGQVKVRPGR